MAKSYGAIFLLTLIVLFMLQTMVMASSGSNVKWSQVSFIIESTSNYLLNYILYLLLSRNLTKSD
ncbi:hypothetical protein AXX17_AT5G14720 [Arabidopsis thaliana]|uniref:Transmembrane protein n=1 Tax=Arabidopsis thaliana TaxID=3702 RepID=A0A178UPN4_ARATH|nr:hypothetical protein AXX17_AT5G14720 [Arabidopsis thaliana]